MLLLFFAITTFYFSLSLGAGNAARSLSETSESDCVRSETHSLLINVGSDCGRKTLFGPTSFLPAKVSQNPYVAHSEIHQLKNHQYPMTTVQQV